MSNTFVRALVSVGVLTHHGEACLFGHNIQNFGNTEIKSRDPHLTDAEKRGKPEKKLVLYNVVICFHRQIIFLLMTYDACLRDVARLSSPDKDT